MLVAQRVNGYITAQRPQALCDQCIAQAVGLAHQAHATQITATLGTTNDFARDNGNCAVCGNERKVIRRT